MYKENVKKNKNCHKVDMLKYIYIFKTLIKLQPICFKYLNNEI